MVKLYGSERRTVMWWRQLYLRLLRWQFKASEVDSYFLLYRKTILRKVLPWVVLIQKSHRNQGQSIFWGAFTFVEYKMFPGQQSILCTGMKSGPMSPINEKKHPALGQGKVRMARGIYIMVMGFLNWKISERGKDLSTDVAPPESTHTPSGQTCSLVQVLQGNGGQGTR